MPLPTIIPSSPIVNIDVSQGNKVVLLPAASTVAGNTYTIRDWRASCGPSSIYVSSIGLDTIDGVRQLVMTSTLEIMKVMSLGNTSWSLLNRNKTVTSNLKIIALLPTNIVFASSSFGSLGTITAAPTWNWTSTGGVITYYTITLYADTNNPPTTSVGGLTPPTASATSYTFPGATVIGYYYKLVVTAFNSVSNFSFDYTQYNNITPVLSYSSFSWVGTQGSTSAQPRWNWSVTSGTIASYTVTLLGDTSNPPTTAITGLSQPSAGATSYTFPGATVLGYYYKFSLTATNPVGTSSAITDIKQNTIPPPSLTQTSASFIGTLGSTDAKPKLVWSNSGGTVASYSLVINYGTTSGLGSSMTLPSPAASATNYTYTYVYFANGDSMPVNGASITITNVSGSTITRLRLTDSYGVIGDFSGLSFAVGQTYTYSLINDLTPNGYVFSIFAYFGSGSPNEVYQVTSNNGVISITTFYGTFLNAGISQFTVANYYYQFVLTATNAAGSNVLTSSTLQNI